MLTFTLKLNNTTGRLIMETVSVLEFRRDAVAVIRKVRQGKRLIMTYRGKPVMRLEPIRASTPAADDPFYKIAQLATGTGQPLTNEEIDQIVYGS
jgi:antitoxin (DNA-binding transcriptional repressor) of toxin-antitoxin stability system